MAEGKNKIIVYSDWGSTFEKLTDEEAGRLIKHFFSYVNDKDPKPTDRLTEIVFEPIKQTLKRDLKAWERKQDINRENGLKGGRPKKANETEENPNNPVGFLETQTNPEKGVSDSVSVTVSDSVKENDILLEKETKDIIIGFNFKKSLIELGVSKEVASDWMEVRRKKKASNTETAFKTLVNEINKTGRSPNECITEAVARSWQGFKAEWITNNKTNGNTTTNQPINSRQTLSERMDAVKQRATERRNQQINSQGTDIEPFSDFQNVD